MHNNLYFLRQLSASLSKILDGFTLVSCFSQNKDELVFEFNNTKKSFFIKASLLPQFSCLFFPSQFQRARKNSIDLFNDALMKSVVTVRQFENERSFSIVLANGYQLLFKMHGQHANIILLKDNTAVEIFKNQFETDLNITPNSLDRIIDWSRENFNTHQSDLPGIYFTLGKPVWEYLHERGFNNESIDQKWNLLQETRSLLENPEFYIVEHKEKVHLTLFPIGSVRKKYNDPVVAINDFFLTYSTEDAFHSEKRSLLGQLNQQLKASESFISKNAQKLHELENDHHYQQWADLIMANLHRIKPGDQEVEVENFYHENRKERIHLKAEISPQKNAEVFYRKSKNQHIEIQKLKEAIDKKEKQVLKIRTQLERVNSASDLKSLRKETGGEKSLSLSNDKSSPPLPFHEFEFKGFRIWVGRNAESNDKLTLHYAFKEDLWLHAKDVSGSHVIIKHQAGKNFPKDVIERAAELAAYNSKRKTDSLCPVAFTKKKFVRKRKADPAGMVVVDREEVILVEPRLEAGS